MANDLHSVIGIFIASITNAQTAKAYREGLTRFEVIAPADLSRVDETYLTSFADTLQGKSFATRQLYLNAAISFFVFLVYSKSGAPVNLDMARLIKRKLLGRPSKRISNYNMSDVQTLINYVRGLTGSARGCRGLENLRDKALILTLAETGLRRSEAAGLKLSDVDFEQRQIIVIGKGDKQAVVYFGPNSLAAVREYIDTRQDLSPSSPLFMHEGRGGLRSDSPHLEPSSINKIVDRRARECLGHGLAVHALRHYFVTSVWKNTHDLMLAKELARHESVLTTQRYTHVDDDQLRDAHRRVFG
jgi:integrase/recombinase XerC